MKLLNVNHLYNIMLNCIDMRISNITVVSQTTKQDVYFNDKILKYNPNGWTLTHRGEVKFDPLNNFKQAQQIFSIFLHIQENEEGFYTQMFYEEKNSMDQTRIIVKTPNEKYASNYYYNMSLGYIELMMVISGIVVDNLKDFDSEPIIEEEKRTRKRVLFPIRDLF